MAATAFWVTIGYASSHLLLALILAIVIYVLAKKKGENLSIRRFLLRVWKMRGIYTPLIIHIYDTATDIGVLYEWSRLARNEKEKGIDYESLDMTTLFWVGIGFMIAYRSLLGLFGFAMTPLLAEESFKLVNLDKSQGCLLRTIKWLFWAIIGFIGGALECGIFVGIFIEQTDVIKKRKTMKEKRLKKQAKKNTNKLQLFVNNSTGEMEMSDHDYYSQALNEQSQCAGIFQKFFQLSEGCLESLPEAIMQSVYLIRSYNDPRLRGSDGSFTNYLIIISVLASILSIANKYVWIDELMVNVYCRSVIVSLQTLLDYLTFKMIESQETKVNNMPYITSKKITSFVVSDIVYQHIKSGWKNKNKNKNNNRIASVDLTPTSIDWKNIQVTDAMMDVARAGKDIAGDDIFLSNHDRDRIPGIINKTIPDNGEWLEKYYESIKKKKYETKWAVNLFFCWKGLKGRYYLSIGYIIRLIWRLSAVTSRFVIFSLIWVVLGGAFEIVLLPIMIVLWYFLMTIYIHYTGKSQNKKGHDDPYFLFLVKSNVKKLKELAEKIESKRKETPKTQEEKIKEASSSWRLMNSMKSLNLKKGEISDLGLDFEIISVIDYDKLDPDDEKLGVYQEMVTTRIKELELQVLKGEEAKKAFEKGGYCVFCLNLFSIFRMDEDCCEEYNGLCGRMMRVLGGLFWYLMILLGGILAGIVFQLGLLFISGNGLYILRMVENVIVMSVITVFAFVSSIDCYYCADPMHRSANKNPRVLTWIIIGWSAITIHILTSFAVLRMIDHDYDFSMDELSHSMSKEVHAIMVKTTMKKGTIATASTSPR